MPKTLIESFKHAITFWQPWQTSKGEKAFSKGKSNLSYRGNGRSYEAQIW